MAGGNDVLPPKRRVSCHCQAVRGLGAALWGLRCGCHLRLGLSSTQEVPRRRLEHDLEWGAAAATSPYIGSEFIRVQVIYLLLVVPTWPLFCNWRSMMELSSASQTRKTRGKKRP